MEKLVNADYQKVKDCLHSGDLKLYVFIGVFAVVVFLSCLWRMNIRETVFNICHGEGIYHQQFIKKKQLQLNPGGRCPSLAFDLNSNRLFRILMQQRQQKYFIAST